MKHLLVAICASAIAAFTIPAGSGTSCADESIGHLSLGHGSVTQMTDDPKAPAPCLLTAKYGFNGLKGITPYVGTGLAYALQPEDKFGNKVKITAGVAGQAGFNFLLGGNSSLNIDYNYLHLSPDSKRGDTPPQCVEMGMKIRF